MLTGTGTGTGTGIDTGCWFGAEQVATYHHPSRSAIGASLEEHSFVATVLTAFNTVNSNPKIEGYYFNIFYLKFGCYFFPARQAQAFASAGGEIRNSKIRNFLPRFPPHAPNPKGGSRTNVF
jgi:hypothetical protein